MNTLTTLSEGLLSMQAAVRNRLCEALRQTGSTCLAEVAHEAPSDTIYRIDALMEETLLEHLERLATKVPFVLIAEGLADEPRPFPAGASSEGCDFRVILDPIDGTRMIMFDKRSAWSLAGVAENRGEGTTCRDIVFAAMTELPTSKQTVADALWASRGKGCRGARWDLPSGVGKALRPCPSRADRLDHGFAQLVKFFPGGKAFTSEIEDRLLSGLGALDQQDRVTVFDDQYLSTGGQIHELLMGKDRFTADLRASLTKAPDLSGTVPGLAAHPYDLCVALIAEEAGVVVTDLEDRPLSFPLDTTSDLDWIGYANEDLHRKIRPVLEEVLKEVGLL
jgi:fructose-1,6-bisphosphatase/inositol monophosphatase family enzyme